MIRLLIQNAKSSCSRTKVLFSLVSSFCRYASDGSEILISPPWFGSFKKIDQCLLYCDEAEQNLGKWGDYNCLVNKFGSVCEENQ